MKNNENAQNLSKENFDGNPQNYYPQPIFEKEKETDFSTLSDYEKFLQNGPNGTKFQKNAVFSQNFNDFSQTFGNFSKSAQNFSFQQNFQNSSPNPNFQKRENLQNSSSSPNFQQQENLQNTNFQQQNGFQNDWPKNEGNFQNPNFQQQDYSQDANFQRQHNPQNNSNRGGFNLENALQFLNSFNSSDLLSALLARGINSSSSNPQTAEILSKILQNKPQKSSNSSKDFNPSYEEI